MNLLFQDLCAVFCRQDNRISYFISKFLRSSQRHRETTQHTVTSTKFFVQKVQLFVYFHYIYKKSAVYLHHLLKLCHNVLKSFFFFIFWGNCLKIGWSSIKKTASNQLWKNWWWCNAIKEAWHWRPSTHFCT